MDTVIIKIHDKRKFRINSRHLFTPEFAERKFDDLSVNEKKRNRQRYYLRRFFFSYPKKELYSPKIDVLEKLCKEKDELQYTIALEFSMPKLIYGNSLEEVSYKDKDAIVSTLESNLRRMGIFISKQALREAQVAAVHFCKNIILPKNIHLRDILDELKYTDIDKTVDVTKKEYKNGGRVLHIYNGTQERVFYDKITDAMRPKGKRKDKAKIDQERAIIKRFKLENTEVFRYEYRIKKGQTVKSILNKKLKRNKSSYVTFEEIFIDNLSRDILQESWSDFFRRPENQLALFKKIGAFGILDHMIKKAQFQASSHSMNTVLISFGIYSFIREHGAKELKHVIFQYWNKDHPERLKKKIMNAMKLTEGLPYSDGITFIDKSIEKYELVTPNILKIKV